jgi:hypothetical protein
MPVDPTNGVLCGSTCLTIGELPPSAGAYTWAKELCAKLGKPILIVDSETAEVIYTVTKEHLAMVKAQTLAASKGSKQAKQAKQASTPREAKTAPDGKRLEIVHLCMRPEGASTKELATLTGWQECPWKWTLGSNKNGTGLCDRYGYAFHTEKVDDEVRYFLTAPAQQAEAARPDPSGRAYPTGSHSGDPFPFAAHSAPPCSNAPFHGSMAR